MLKITGKRIGDSVASCISFLNTIAVVCLPVDCSVKIFVASWRALGEIM